MNYRFLFSVWMIFGSIALSAQVGVNTTTPNAQLEIKSSNEATPANTDGLIIPKVDAFPATNPTAAQQSMLVYLTTASGTDLPGFYYWDNTTIDWKPIMGANVGTLDQAYDFGGAGNGKTIIADAGAVTINGTDGLVVTGINGSGAIPPSGGGSKMIWNPNKASFRAGRVTTNQWDNANTGGYSVAFGDQTIASGNYSSAFGLLSVASGPNATAFGLGTNSASGSTFSAGFNTDANGYLSTVFGDSNVASSYGETIFGIGATTYTASSGGVLNFQPANANDRLFVIGNAIDTNANLFVDTTERSDAMIVLKNGLTRLPSTTNAMISAADGKAIVTKEYLQSNTSGTLDQAYDFGGAGLGRTITADNGAVTINGTDGLVSTGTFGSGDLVPTGAGTRMVWNPRKAAFRVGSVFGTQWDDANVGLYSSSFGVNSIASGQSAFSFGQANQATGNQSLAFGFTNVASGQSSTAFGHFNTASGNLSTTFGINTSANGDYSLCFGRICQANGENSICAGINNIASSYGEVVLGIGATNYIPSLNGATQFRSANATDRLLVVGNAIDSNNSGFVDFAERSNALVILKNGNTGIGSSIPQEKLHVVGNIRMVDGNQAAGKVLTSDANGTATWQNASNNAWGLVGNTGTNATTNFIGTIDNVDLVFKRNNISSGRIALNNTFLGVNSGVANTADYNTFIGERAGFANATGQDNTFLGRLAGANGTFGDDNSYIGYAAGLNSTGNSNIIFGAFAGQNTTGNFNVFVGNQTASTNTTGARNTLLGFNADVGAAGLSNATAIGNLAQVDTSNSLVLGSVSGVNGATTSVNVGIGTTSPIRALHVSTGSSGGTPLGSSDIVLESNGPTYQHFLTPSTSETGLLFGSNLNTIHSGIIANNTSNTLGLIFRTGGNTNRMSITSAGDVGIGTLAPGGQFELSLNEGRKPGTNTWTIVSDARLKEVSGSYDKGLNEIAQLRPIRYHYKNEGNRKFEQKVLDEEFSGFLAQEVQQIFPEAVGADSDGYLNFNMHSILVASVNAIKELDAQNKKLQQENEALKAQLTAQQQKLDYILSEIEKIKNK